ncbi:zinc-ribbon domain-containing protein [Peribacillus sp. SI8-4]|uniref:zinc-ribbon domain-containing protein n=1 Tax=Peribacillus sp. SI8-4 TaxID=3048009 RepID=UPI0025544E81|nr:zinc-ribbon domain-containing protein [Peribacillus sp. SI8-4]
MGKLLKEHHPELLKEYDYNKNEENLLETLTLGSSKKVWWICKESHPSYEATCHNRIKNNSGCPYCSNLKAYEGNSLATLSPYIAAEWNYKRNGDLTPNDVTNGSSKKVWWTCKYGHEWQASISPRTKRGVGCPECFKRTNTSFSEQCILYYLQKIFPNIKNRKKIKINGKIYEADIYIKDLNIAIEYDGGRAHKNKFDKDLKKRMSFQKVGIRIINVREGELPSLTENHQNELIIEEGRRINDKNRTQMIKKLMGLLNVNYSFEIDVEKDRVHILEMYHLVRAKNNILQKSPEIAAQWHPTKNGTLKPEYFPSGSHEKVWWLGKCGHEWQAVIRSRTKKDGYGCPYCRNLYANETNSLESLNPEMLKFWDFDKNNADEIYPSGIVPSSPKEAWWKCSKGHSFKSGIRVRLASRHEGCPYCIGRKVSKENSLGTKRPWALQYWDFEKNNKNPYEFTAKSESDVFWRCKKCNHTWQEQIHNIERRKSFKCPSCEIKDIQPRIPCDGHPDKLLTDYPIFFKEWHFEKNKDLNINTILCGSKESAWWKCNEGHEWYKEINRRTKRFKDCPRCYSKTIIKNPILRNKKLMRYWDFESNVYAPSDIGIYSTLRLHWKCEKNHRWIQSPDTLVSCPECSEINLRHKNKKLLHQHAEIFQEWDFTKNINIDLELLKMGSPKKYFWKCKKKPEHIWESNIPNRIGRNKNGCPYCSGKKQGPEKLLQNARPDLLKYWDFEKNKDTPLDVLVGSGKRRFWRCPDCQHAWDNRIDSIAKRKKICPSCTNK